MAMKLKNKYFILRHGESLKNKLGVASSWPETIPYPLTENGKKQAKAAAKKLKNKKIDLIFTSDLLRTKQTAGIVGKALGIKPKPDKRLREINVGIFNNQPIEKVGDFWNKGEKLPPLKYYQARFKSAPKGGENYSQVEKRLVGFIKYTEKQYQSKNILIVSHERTLTLFEKAIYGDSLQKFIENIMGKKEIKTGELRKIN